MDYKDTIINHEIKTSKKLSGGINMNTFVILREMNSKSGLILVIAGTHSDQSN